MHADGDFDRIAEVRPLLVQRTATRIIDTLALPAILRSEPEARSCADATERSAVRHISPANVLECALVIDSSHDPIASRWMDDHLQAATIVVELVTKDQTQIWREAHRDFG